MTPSPRGLAWLIGLAGCALRLAWAATSYGTNDVVYFTAFTDAAGRYGPIHVYGAEFPIGIEVYNHGPLTSWMLYGFSQLVAHGASFSFLIRVPASIADLVTTVLVYELVRGRRGERTAVWSALVFAASPVALIVAGFHGNTDPVIVCLVLVAVWALVQREASGFAGLAIGLALSVKLVPIVALPVLLVLAWRRGRAAVWRFVAAGAAVFVVLWVPVLILERGPFVDNVLGYAGSGHPFWGLPQLAHSLGVSWSRVVQVCQDIRLVPVAVAGLVPAVLALRARSSAELLAAACCPLPLLLLLSTATGMQYLVWPLAPLIIAVPLRVSTTYAAGASAYALAVYSGWTEGWPWQWDVGGANYPPDWVLPVMFAAWVTLAIGCVAAVGIAHGGLRTAEVRGRHSRARAG